METEFQKNYWMHRVSYDKDIKRTLLEKDGLLITGWNKISNDTFLKEIEGKERTEYDIIYEKYCGKLSRNRFCLYLFLCRFQKGDYVIVPDTEIFSVYELVSDKAFSKEHIREFVKSDEGKHSFEFRNGHYYKKGSTEEIDLGFFWQVRPITTNISRKEFADNNLQKRLKFQMTNIGMTDLKEEIENAIRQKAENRPVILKNEIIESTRNIVVEKLKNKINDTGFEKLIQWYLNRLGADSTLSPSKNALTREKGDVDVIAVFEDLGITVFVQAKQYDNIVDKRAIEQIVKAYESAYKDMYPGTAVLWVISTCNQFSKDAIEYANENQVKCIGGEEFAKRLLDIGFKDLTL